MFYVRPMRGTLLFAALAAPALLGLTSCVEPEKKPVGPTSNTSNIPWNKPVPGQGQGQFGMLEQNRYRR